MSILHRWIVYEAHYSVDEKSKITIIDYYGIMVVNREVELLIYIGYWKTTHIMTRKYIYHTMSESPPERPKITKWLASHGIASRRQAEYIVKEGAVTVNGAVMTNPAERICPERDVVTVDGKTLGKQKPQTRLWKFYKPKGCLTSAYDPEGRTTIYDILPEQYQHVRYVGRLDYNTEGLLLLTNDGELARALTDPAAGIPRVYRARCRGNPDPRRLDLIRKGVTIEGMHYRPADICVAERTANAMWVDMTLTEGKYREVRVLLDYAGLQVSRLIRVSYGPYRLADLSLEDVEEVIL